jgi:hypothetical protein
MPESFATTLRRWGFNFFPAYRGTGARITYIADDWREVHIRLPLSWRTRNYVGSIFGGSMYGAVDPIYMIMLIKVLGSSYTVWDKAATIRFKAPGRTTLFARFRLSMEETDNIRAVLLRQPTTERHYTVELSDSEGKVHAEVDKTIHIRGRDAKPAAR